MLLKNLQYWPLESTGSLLPGNAAGTGEWTFCKIFLLQDHLLLKYVQCTAWYFPIPQFKEMLSSCSTGHHPLHFSNWYASWLTFRKDHGFHPKLRGANRFFFSPVKWTLNILIHFSGQSCNSLTFFTLAPHKNYSAASKVFRLHCHRFQCFTKDWVNTPKRNAWLQ